MSVPICIENDEFILISPIPLQHHGVHSGFLSTDAPSFSGNEEPGFPYP